MAAAFNAGFIAWRTCSQIINIPARHLLNFFIAPEGENTGTGPVALASGTSESTSEHVGGASAPSPLFGPDSDGDDVNDTGGSENDVEELTLLASPHPGEALLHFWLLTQALIAVGQHGMP